MANIKGEELQKKLEAGESVELEPTIETTPESKIEEGQEVPLEDKKDGDPEGKPSAKAKPWNEYREERKQWTSERNELREQIEELKSRFEERDSKESNAALDSEITSLAEQYKASPDVIKGILNIASKKIKPDVDPQIRQEVLDYRESKQFEKEWDDLLPDLSEMYPNATYVQLRKAQRLMDELSHSEDYSLEGAGENVTLGEILEAEEGRFDELLSSAKSSKGFESRQRGVADKTEPEKRRKPDFENMSYDQIHEWEQKRDEEDAQFERESSGRTYDGESKRF